MPNVDGFTAKVALEALLRCPEQSGAIWDTIKPTVSSGDGGPSQEAIDFFELNQGKLVSVKLTGYTGKLVALNKATGGFYPGSCYPFYVQITASDDPKWGYVIGDTFEYSMDQVTLAPD